MEDCDCGYCGRCREQMQHEIDTQPTSTYDLPDDDSEHEPRHYYWRL